MRGDRVEIVIDAGGSTKTYQVEATRAGRRVDVSHGRGIVEVTEVTRGGTAVRTARFMASRVLALVEHPARQRALAADELDQLLAWRRPQLRMQDGVRERMVDHQRRLAVQPSVRSELGHGSQRLAALRRGAVPTDQDRVDHPTVGVGNASGQPQQYEVGGRVLYGDEHRGAQRLVMLVGHRHPVHRDRRHDGRPIMVTRMGTSTALTTVVLNRPIWRPTAVAARSPTPPGC